MKINELLLEISAGEARRRKKAAAEEERKRQQELKRIEDEKLKARLQKKIGGAVLQPLSPNPEQQEKLAPVTSFGGVEIPSELQFDPKYQEIEGTEDIGVYLKFHREQRNSDVFAYYSKYSNMTWAGVQTYAGQIPTINLGKRFNGTKFKKLLAQLVEETSTSTHAGYVSIVIDNNDKKYKDGDRFFTELLMWLRINYPQTGTEMDATVYWEII